MRPPRLLVIGLDCAAPELLLGMEELSHVRRLMEAGCYGRLESVIPPITVPAWLCMATSQDPGSLGIYGFRNRKDRSYDALATVDSRSVRALTIWDQVARQGGRSVLVGVPPSFPPRKLNGVSVGCFLTPDPATDAYTHPLELADEISELVGDYPVDVKGFRTDDKGWLRDQLYDMTRKHFEVVRHLLRTREWAYFHLVEIGLDRIQHGFWKHHDPKHVEHDPRSPYREVVADYYRYLDGEIGSVLELVDEDTVVLIASDHGARPLDGGFCVNEWLVREGYLKLNRYPDRITPLDQLDVRWEETTAWSSGGYYARIFLNVRGREARGVVHADSYERVRSELADKLAATTDPGGRPLGTRVFRPEQIYERVTGVAPDLIVHFGDLAWRAVGGVGYAGVHVRENDTGPDDCNHAQHGAFVLAGAGVPAIGGLRGVHLLDIAPTLLALGGYDVPAEMQGRALLEPSHPTAATAEADLVRRDEIIRERLRGLGYLG